MSDLRARSIFHVGCNDPAWAISFPSSETGIHDVERGRDGGDGGYRDNDMEKSRLICFLRVWHFLLWHTRTHIQVYLHPHMHPHMHHRVLQLTQGRKCLAH